MQVAIITAMTKDRVIGKNNKLPWYIPAELKYFKQVTMGKVMIMGRKTFDSIGRRLLPGRKTIILTTQDLPEEGFLVAHDPQTALQLAQQVIADENLDPEIMIVGGTQVYSSFLPIAKKLYISEVKQDFSGDTLFPKYECSEWKLQSCDEQDEYCAKIYTKAAG